MKQKEGGMETRDFMVSGEGFHVVPAGTEGVLCTRPCPEDLSRYYDSPDYLSHTDGGSGLLGWFYARARALNLSRKLGGIARVIPTQGRLLDLGAGTGAFVRKAREKGFEAQGMEPNAEARKQALQKGVELHPDLHTIAAQKFDVITLWHVLEHIPDLEVQLNWLQAHLEPGGLLVLALPNYQSWDARHYAGHWAGYDVPRHLWHFSRQGIQNTLQPYGFTCTQIRPMWMDAFYVAWLSERYRQKRFPMIRGFFKGMYSNGCALFTGQYSALTYYFRRY
ncbi:class I SAM-dependent methyltransferase [Robiginitalea sp. M366]|uniref:class I SAM-dependent methyltransferase n=1 Tax=Robiginitalea aestuariiviva TaxID=3036903 RepID=UPI00240D204F|nr:class I SAM-dependent methyltransferase [Robiginitalea aestuariiviva]MDG1571499.1 class I SAM-dependent methyltransferase [Robiginitalea aestuariiviva]